MLKQILLTHARKYPQMEPRDAVKLLYQSQFGGGHLICDEAACMEFLRKEYAATPQTDAPLLEDIGNSMVRVMLSALDAHGYAIDQLGKDFIRSATLVHGSMHIFCETLTLLRELTQSGQMPFPAEELQKYLADYAADGYPAVSHSNTYRSAYRPAYRVLHISHLPSKFRKQV